MSATSRRSVRLPLAASLLAAAAAAQGPRLHAAVAGSEQRGAVPAYAWLCEEYLPSLPSWPEGLDPRGPLSLTFTAQGVQVGATEVVVPDGAVAVGTASFAEESGGPSLLWRCENDGAEHWTVQPGFELPRSWRVLLQAIEGDALEAPRSLAVAVLAAHLSGSMLEGDPRATLLRICPSLCGDATWVAWRDAGELHVRGRSEGGLMLPTALLLTAAASGDAEPTALQLRAFAARDADKGEATRQLGRGDRELDVETLRALLRGADDVRLTAIDVLIRRRAWQQLPQIVAAAGSDLPWATIAARDAVYDLWEPATAEVRQQTRQALQQSSCPQLRAIDVESIGAFVPYDDSLAGGPPGLSRRARLLLLLLCTGVGVLGLWGRARLRRRAAALAQPALAAVSSRSPRRRG